MGKSPRKWFRTLLLRGKSSRSRNRKENMLPNDQETCSPGKEPQARLPEEAPLSLQPVSIITGRNERNLDSGQGVDPSFQDVALQSRESEGSVNSISAVDQRRLHSAVLVQATFRSFLACRAFRALRGVIKLQSLIRGRLVRRQAITTMHCLYGIVKLQALFRGRVVRHSNTGADVYKKITHKKILDNNPPAITSWKEKLPTNAFIRELITPSPSALVMQIHYAKEDPNSAFTWLHRWSIVRFWKPLPQMRKADGGLEGQSREGLSCNVEVFESRKSKCIDQRNVPSNGDSSASIDVSTETGRPRRNLKKAAITPMIDSTREHQQSEFEKIKRNLRKVSTLITEVSSEELKLQPEKPKSLKNTSSHHFGESGQACEDCTDKIDKDSTVLISTSCVETAVPLRGSSEREDILSDGQQGAGMSPEENNADDENVSVVSVNVVVKEDQTCQENRKGSRRVSLPAKGDENGLSSIPALPSYMAATESAKAKSRGQGSPRFILDVMEKNGLTRRHSLPTSANGKVGKVNLSTQPQRVAGGKAGSNRSDRSLSSRDGNEKGMADWRR